MYVEIYENSQLSALFLPFTCEFFFSTVFVIVATLFLWFVVTARMVSP